MVAKYVVENFIVEIIQGSLMVYLSSFGISIHRELVFAVHVAIKGIHHQVLGFLGVIGMLLQF